MGTYDVDKYPWLFKEKEFILQTIKAGKKVLGICLGSQLLAEILGGKVYKNTEKEIGWFPVTLTFEGKNNVLFKDMEDTLNVFHWHGDTFTLPEKSIHLISSAGCENQAYLYQNNVLGLQFHFEATPESINSMLVNDSEDLETLAKFIQNRQEILNSLHYSHRANEILFILLERFLTL